MKWGGEKRGSTQENTKRIVILSKLHVARANAVIQRRHLSWIEACEAIEFGWKGIDGSRLSSGAIAQRH